METSAEAVTKLVFQLAAMLLAAKLGGELCQRYLGVPAVLGELAAGVAIGPFALGGVDFRGAGRLFEAPPDGGWSGLPLSPSLWAIAQVASVVLLFEIGLETDRRAFLRYAGRATLVATGGVALPFALGLGLAVAFGLADGASDPKAMFLGAVLTATSVGVTVRVLADLGNLASPEGVTVLAAAVLDDVLGVLVLAVVVGISTAEGGLTAGSVALVSAKVLGFWVGLTALLIFLSGALSRALLWLRVGGAAVAISLALALLASALAEQFGLAMIIGAFSVGLGLSGTELARRIGDPMRSIAAALVPVFFVAMGALVDPSAIGGVWAVGLALSAAAIVSKFVGCGLPALAARFSVIGAARIGVAMVPRGEVALVMAGVGVAHGVIGPDLFGAAIMVTAVTTLVGPLELSRMYAGPR